jgi:hypothetical protein
MLSENEPRSARYENWPSLLIGLLLILGILLTVCALSVLLLNRQKQPHSAPQPEIPVMLIPTAAMPKAMPVNYYSIRLPIVLSGSGSSPVSVQIWKVTKIHTQGYELGGQRYDLATFTRIDGQDTVKGYCINPGWDIPDIGTEYLLTAGGTFVPLQEREAHPFQSFFKIQ